MGEKDRLLKEKNRKKPSMYIAYLVMIICLVYITDEIASNICTQMKTEIANDLFSAFGEASVGKLDTLALLSYLFIAVSLFYRTLSDRFGRKPFLIVNTLGMAAGMFMIYVSASIPMYILGYCIISFFVPHDMQVVYIMESAPAKHRAKIYSIIKCISTFGVMLIPLFRKLFMTGIGEWRKVFMIPAVIGLVSSLCALIFARETDTFIDSRLKYLELSDEERKAKRAEKRTENAQGGFFTAFKYSMKDKQLRLLFILMAFFNLGFIITTNYQVMLSYGFAKHLVKVGTASGLETALALVSENEVTAALFLFPIGSALLQLLQGFIADKAGRKPASLIMAVCTVLSFCGFVFGANLGLDAHAVGFLAGACVGSFWAFGDINVMMMSESAPTNLRASVLSACYIIDAIGTFVGMGILIPLMNKFGNSITAPAALCIAIPGIIVAVVLLTKTRETKGTVL